MSGDMQQVLDLWFADDGLVTLPYLRFFNRREGGSDMIDGIPVVQLHDSPEDVEPFLRAIFYSRYEREGRTSLRSLMNGILRLAHKYEVEYLFRRALFHLESLYPIDLIGYNNIGSHHTMLNFRGTAEVEATWLLPYAYYITAGVDLNTLFATGNAWKALAPHIKETCCFTHAHQLQGVVNINGFLTEYSTCSHSESCNTVKFNFLSMLHHRTLDAPDPLADWSEDRWRELKKGLCGDCFILSQKMHDTSLADIWNDLPANCRMKEGWDVFLGKRRTVLYDEKAPPALD
ncbi:hypothetical protein C8R43DRAFT_1240370 [Mycena crocata]|nr:hypothetical protein C8R43DRAFT_1240370 [Mycena crocata]